MEDINCPNFEVCESLMDPRMRTCSSCAFRRIVLKSKDVLVFADNIECPVCLEVNRGVQNPRCVHFICIDCYKECNWIKDISDDQPPFPYNSTVEEDYDEHPEKYDSDPIIQVWRACMETYLDEIDEYNESRRNLRLCPVCRA